MTFAGSMSSSFPIPWRNIRCSSAKQTKKKKKILFQKKKKKKKKDIPSTYNSCRTNTIRPSVDDKPVGDSHAGSNGEQAGCLLQSSSISGQEKEHTLARAVRVGMCEEYSFKEKCT